MVENIPLTDILSSIKANDEHVLKRIYTIYYPQVEEFILFNNGVVSDAKDIYQETFLVFWRNIQLDKFTATTNNDIKNYILAIARNKWIDILRIRKRNLHITIDDMEDREDLTDLGEDQKHYTKLVQHFANIKEPCKELLFKFYYKKEKLRDIAQYYSWTEATAKNNKYRCLEKLRKMVSDKKTLQE